MKGKNMKSKVTDKLKWMTLLVTGSTLLCCALPILLVSFGLGATVASLNFNIPGLLFLAEHKVWTFSISAIMLLFLVWIIWRPNQSCPSDPQLAKYCETSKKWNKRVFFLSIAIWFISFFASYLLLPLREFLNI
jgi:ABC-type Mn2+/Zn2+ transport system permease subunit